VRYDQPAVREALAAEYVLGTLQGPARRRFERLMAARPEWRREVELWSTRLAALAAGVPSREPPRSVWAAIQSRVRPRERVRTPLRWWKALAAASTLAAIVLAIALVAVPEQVLPPHTAVLKDADARAGWLVSFSRRPGEPAEIRVAAEAVQAIAGRAFELWVLPGAGAAPISLGLLPDRGEARLPVRTEIAALLTPGAALAVSVEPPGGSPTGQPTGPVTYQGKLTAM
jgi:anti-sigma-K factor RskA